ncbi:unnamed protein product [Didymodactylos carnosus]|uniref:SOCS box domain-containing protein n=1 Tax=Didymodactylos carnosus TaxID=1234261 RepID=A0A813RXH4_9BILA|nr:unnamed protein product [Didymodactylos carnosus]CAF1233996.1 unnamed protein product [Didymodactylos carnosus]CAF3575239.1 unnamed protein product [Didymodactylos carnosus]CAF4042133.1 unnamed protein product [Didymodactylos carnosus]
MLQDGTDITGTLPKPLSVDEPVQHYLSSTSTFLTNHILNIAFSPCSKYLAVPKQDIYGRDRVVVIRCSDWHSTIKDEELSIHNQFSCTATCWSLAFGKRHHETEAKDVPIQKKLLMLSRRRSSLSAVNRRFDFTKDLFLAAGLADGKINIWDINTGELMLVLKDHQSTVRCLSFTSTSMQLASCSSDSTVKLWDLLDDGNMYKTLNEWSDVVYSVKWSPDETLLCITGPVGHLALHNTVQWSTPMKLVGHIHNVVDCSFSSDSALLATASFDTRVIVWSTSTGEILKECYHKTPMPSLIYAGGDNGAYVRCVQFSKNNDYLVTVCDDNKVRWFPLSKKNGFPIYEKDQSNVLSIACTKDGRTLAIGTRNGEVHLWSTLYSLPPKLKNLCRIKLNSVASLKRNQLSDLPLSHQLYLYLLYKDLLPVSQTVQKKLSK